MEFTSLGPVANCLPLSDHRLVSTTLTRTLFPRRETGTDFSRLVGDESIALDSFEIWHWISARGVCFQTGYLNSDRFKFIQSIRYLILLAFSLLSLFKRISGISLIFVEKTNRDYRAHTQSTIF